MAERDIICPSGFAGRLRGLKAKEFRLLSNRKRAKSGELYDDILEACWLETTEEGPYKPRVSGRPDWPMILVGDRFTALLKLRMATYPEEKYAFQVKCSSCGEKIDWELDLDDLPVKPLSPESFERFVSGSPFETHMRDKLIRFRLGIGKDEVQSARFLRGGSPDPLRALALRIIEIEGVEDRKKVEWLEDLDLPEHQALVAAFDEVDCGVETNIEVECQECGGIVPVDLPFGQDFLMPKKQKK